MTNTVTAEPIAAVLFAGLLDDAALFPPGNAHMNTAVASYLQSKQGPRAAYIGSFLCSSKRVGELREALPAATSLDLALVVPDGVEALPAAVHEVLADERLRLRALELPAGDAGVALTLDALSLHLPSSALAYVEVPLDAHLGANADAIAATGYRVKMRTGGTVATAFPDAARLAAGLIACARADVPFKLTAGLHNAHRHRDGDTGFEHHGFLNVLAAVATAAGGGQAPEVATLLEERDAAKLAQWARTLPQAAAHRARRLFVGFGTCSIDEPLQDLRDLGLLKEDGA
jgi:hypothetical protein